MTGILHIPRTLTSGEARIPETELLAEPGVVIVLAEPGAGKTSLLASIGRRLGVRPTRGSVFDGTDGTRSLVVDALDEVARLDAAGITPLLKSIRRAGAERTLIASRSSEWEPAQTAFIRDLFETDPIVVHLEPLDEHQQRMLFEHEYPDADFDAFASDVLKFDLAPLLGNPQLLKLFAAAHAEGGGAFSTRDAIFEDAMKFLAHEANDQVFQRNAPTRTQRIAWADEVFAKLLLSGAEGVAVYAGLDERYPALGDLGIRGEGHASILDTRLFKPAVRAGNHEPVHRIVAEYGAARHLVGLINDSSNSFSIRQCLAVVAPNGVSRDELRGLLGWTAALGTQETQEAIISVDPYAVLANGDPSRLSSRSKRLLLDGLVALSGDDPFFRRHDFWRSFSASGFFTSDTVDAVRRILHQHDDGGHLKSLVFQLLEGSPAVDALVSELESHVLDSAATESTRLAALDCLLARQSNDWDPVLVDLVRESGRIASRLSARIVESIGPSHVAPEVILQIIYLSADLLQRVDDRVVESRYHVRRLIKKFDQELSAWLLDRLTEGLNCTCGAKSAGLCHCRDGISKVAGLLLDRFFEVDLGPKDHERVWRWIEPLNYHGPKRPSDSAAVKSLQDEDVLRLSIQKLLLKGRESQEAVSSAFFNYLHGHQGHSGLTLKYEDVWRLVDWAFEIENRALWCSLIPNRPSVYSPSTWQPDPLRRHMRAQSRENPDFQRLWFQVERRRREFEQAHREPRYRFLSRRKRRERRIMESNNRSLREDRDLIHRGAHFGWIRHMASIYLIEPEKIAEEFGREIDVALALRNALSNLPSGVPTVEQLAVRRGTAIARIFHAGCLAEFRAVGHIDSVSEDVLKAARTDLGGYDKIPQAEAVALEEEIDRRIFSTPGSAETLLRQLVEPALESGELLTSLHWLSQNSCFTDLQSTLPLEWLRLFPEMHETTRDRLFDIAARHGDRSSLVSLILERCNVLAEGIGPHRWETQRIFWYFRNAFFVEKPDPQIWMWLTRDPNMIFGFESQRENRRHFGRDSGWPELSAQKIGLILDAFVDEWPAVELPSIHGTSSPRGERAYRYLTEIVWSIGRDDPDNAIEVIDRLQADPRFEHFDQTFRSVRSTSLRMRAHRDFRPPTPGDVVEMLRATQPVTVEHLRALLVEQLQSLQKEIRGSDLDVGSIFFDGGRRVDENTASMRLITLLRPRLQSLGLSDALEHQMADGNRCDITVSMMVNGRRRLLVIEVKGQWNRQLFTAAEAQLYDKYSIHPDAAEQGIYLVLWFGNGETIAGRRDDTITTSEDLANRIKASVPEHIRTRLDVVVLDLFRPAAGSPP